MTRPTNLSDYANREAQRAKVEGLDLAAVARAHFPTNIDSAEPGQFEINVPAPMTPERDAEYRQWWARERANLIAPRSTRLEIELALSTMLAGAFRELRETLAPVLDAAERYEVARALYDFHDGYDGAPADNDSSGPSYLPYAVALGAALYISSGKLDNSQSWWDHWHADCRALPITREAWLRDQLLEAADSFPEMRDTFERAAQMVACGETD